MLCPQCRHDNVEAARFCNECGHKLQPAPSTPSSSTPSSSTPSSSTPSPRTAVAAHPPLAGERRKVTILFADLSGSTALGEKFDAEEVYGVMNDCFAGLTAIIDRHEGFVVKFIGDCIMALFGAPLAHGDDPQRAVQSALEMQQWLQGFSARLEREKGVPFRMRIGLNFGSVIAGGVGSEFKKEYDVLGDAVNVAQRLEAAAEPGTIYVGDALWRLTRRQFEYSEIGPIQVKGRAEPVLVFRVLGPRAVDDAADVAFEARLIGRDREWQALAGAIALLLEGQGGLVTLSGEPGIGKTRLLEDAAAYAAEAGALILAARCQERSASRPFALFVALLRGLCDVREADSARAATRKVETWLDARGAELAVWRPYLLQLLAPEYSVPQAGGPDEETRKQLLAQGVCKAIEGLSRERPLLLAIDDFHLVDELSGEVARTLAQGGGALLLLLAARPGEGFEWAPPHRALRLDVLPRAECVEMIGQFVEPAALPAPLLDAILDRSGGNPHYLKEVVRSLLDAGQLWRAADGRWQAAADLTEIEVPDTVYGAILARLDRLELSARALLQCGAVAGLQFPVRLVEAMLTTPTGLPHTLRLLETLEFLREAQPPPEWEQHFKHSSVREVAYEALLRQERKNWHRRAAELLVELYPARRDELAPVLAHHYQVAEVWPRAVAERVRAGRRAAAFFANAEAVEHFSIALELLPQLSNAERAAAPHELDALEGLSAVCAGRGESAAAIAHCRVALDCEALRRLPEHVQALRAATLRWRLADCLLHVGQMPEAEALLKTAWRALRGFAGGEFDRERSALLAHLGFARYRAGRYRPAQRWGRLAARFAEYSGDERTRADAANLLGLAAQALGQWEDARRHYEAKSAAARRAGDVGGIGIAENNLGTLFYQQGRLDEAQTCYERALEQWRKTGSVAQMATTFNNIGNVQLARGDFERAAPSFQAAIEMFHRAAQPHGEATALAVLGEVELERGRGDTCIVSLQKALALLQPLAAPDLKAYILTTLATAYIEQNAWDKGAEYSRQALAAAQELRHPTFEGIARRALGKIARLRDDKKTAAAELEQARRIFDENGLPHELGRTLLEIGILQRATGRLEEAEYSRREAMKLLEQVGAQVDLARARAAWDGA
jgi:class 3 adenylate cyclase/tetratricopeptide (TPR) repeat protein